MEHANIKTMSPKHAAESLTLASVFQYSHAPIHTRSSTTNHFADPVSASQNAASSYARHRIIASFRSRYARLTRQGQACAPRNVFLPRNSKGSAHRSGRPHSPFTFRTGNAAVNCGLARQPFRRRFLMPMQRCARFHSTLPWDSARANQHQTEQHHLFSANEVATALQFPHQSLRPLLLRPHSHTTAFHSRLPLLSPCRPSQGTGYQSGGHSASRISPALLS